ncbi:MAG: hypothetical protein HUJ27_08820 [Rhodobacteraceae bacterium]|nr:hypothetical protein [Paracoccaceae bacterium]
METATDPAAFADWPDGLYEEMVRNDQNGCVGTVLVSETDRVRVWHLRLAPGERLPFHKHVNPYFWTVISPGSARAYFSDGRIAQAEYYAGQTSHYHYGPDEYMLHSLENIGETQLFFTTVEFLDGTNPPLPVPDSVRL